MNHRALTYDTQDLSTIRGSGLALLWAPREVAHHLRDEWLPRHETGARVEIIRTGASEGLFRVERADENAVAAAVEDFLDRGRSCPESEDPSALVASPWQHMVFIVGTAPDEGDFVRNSEAAIAEARAGQYRAPTLPLPSLELETGGNTHAPCGHVPLGGVARGEQGRSRAALRWSSRVPAGSG